MIELTSAPTKVVEKSDIGRQMLTVRRAERAYFVGKLRQEHMGGHPFNIYREIPDDVLGALNANLDDCLSNGGIVAIIDVTNPEGHKMGSHVVARDSYTRHMEPHFPSFKEHKLGDLSVRVRKPADRRLPEGLEVQVREDSKASALHNITWDDEKIQNHRFAVLTYIGDKWRVVLDFRLPEDNAPVAAWKVNTAVLSR